MQHRELLAPGPATRELRIRASPYQELACGRPKRKARSSTKESSSGSADEKDLQRTKQGNDQPIKALKVIHHRFSNGQPTNEHLRRVRNSYENDKSPRMGESSQSGEDVDSLQAGLDSSIYQGTFLGNWKCQAHEHDLRHTDEEKVNHPVLGRCMYQNERANTQTPNLPVADAAVNSSSESLSLHHHHPTTFAVSKSHPRSVNNRTVGDKTTDPYQLPQYPLMSIRDMALNLHPKVHAHNHTFNAEDDEAALASATASISPPVSPVAHGRVWESRATRRQRRRQELELGRHNPSTSTVSTADDTAEVYPPPEYSFPLDGALSEPPVRFETLSATSNTFPVSATAPKPRRFRNQDTDCLVCLAPVTPSDLLVIDLRCVACPRVFHGACLTYITPSMNQNWRCSLCYREAWHGYGHLAVEREMRQPSLVERYRRRLLLAKTYGDPGAGPESVRFWFDVDMDGGVASDQAVLVRMGLVNEYKLRVVGGAYAVGPATTVEAMERWGIAMGMALQEKAAKVAELGDEVERLRGTLRDREREIAELEGGL